MSKLFKALSSLLLLLLLAAFIGCEGDEGPQGPPGEPGTKGPPGEPGDAAPPADRYFGISIVNNYVYDHNGAPVVRLTFDSTAAPSDSVVVGQRLSQPPQLDGQLSDQESWQVTEASSIPLQNLRGEDNEIAFVDMRAGFDEDNIYLFILWTEVRNVPTGIFDIGPNRIPGRWIYDGEEEVWNRSSENEDECMLFWDIDGVADWSTVGSAMLYHGSDSTLYLDGTGLIDVWAWSAGRGGWVGHVADMFIDGSRNNGAPMFDMGTGSFIENIDDTLPRWQHRRDPNRNPSPPFLQWDAVPFSADLGWTDNARIQGYTIVLPTGSQADIEVNDSEAAWGWAGAPDSWVLEIRRARNTGNGDDVQF